MWRGRGKSFWPMFTPSHSRLSYTAVATPIHREVSSAAEALARLHTNSFIFNFIVNNEFDAFVDAAGMKRCLRMTWSSWGDLNYWSQAMSRAHMSSLDFLETRSRNTPTVQVGRSPFLKGSVSENPIFPHRFFTPGAFSVHVTHCTTMCIRATHCGRYWMARHLTNHRKVTNGRGMRFTLLLHFSPPLTWPTVRLYAWWRPSVNLWRVGWRHGMGGGLINQWPLNNRPLNSWVGACGSRQLVQDRQNGADHCISIIRYTYASSFLVKIIRL